MEFLITFGLLVFGILLYAVFTVWQKIRKEGFDANKFFNENKLFWGVCIALSLMFAFGLVYIEGFKTVVHSLGFAVEEDNQAGYVLLGSALALGSDKTKITGEKKINTPE